MDGELVTVADVAEILKVNKQTIRNWIDAGTVPHVWLGRRVRVWRSDFSVLVGESTAGHQPPAPVQTIWDRVIAAAVESLTPRVWRVSVLICCHRKVC